MVNGVLANRSQHSGRCAVGCSIPDGVAEENVLVEFVVYIKVVERQHVKIKIQAYRKATSQLLPQSTQ